MLVGLLLRSKKPALTRRDNKYVLEFFREEQGEGVNTVDDSNPHVSYTPHTVYIFAVYSGKRVVTGLDFLLSALVDGTGGVFCMFRLFLVVGWVVELLL